MNPASGFVRCWREPEASCRRDLLRANRGLVPIHSAMLSCFMITTLDEIHRDPAILDRAIARRERLDILSEGELAATLLPKLPLAVEEARRVMRERFAAPDWEFAMGTPMNRDERNARA